MRTPRARASAGSTASRRLRLVGVIAAAPIACTARAATRNQRSPVAAHARLAAVKTETPARKTGLWPHLSATLPIGTRKAAKTTA